MNINLSARIDALLRRAILDLVEDVGGELNDQQITIFLNEIGHRVARRDVRAHIAWLADSDPKLLTSEQVGEFVVVTSTPDGRDVATGRQRVDGVSRHKTGE